MSADNTHYVNHRCKPPHMEISQLALWNGVHRATNYWQCPECGLAWRLWVDCYWESEALPEDHPLRTKVTS